MGLISIHLLSFKNGVLWRFFILLTFFFSYENNTFFITAWNVLYKISKFSWLLKTIVSDIEKTVFVDKQLKYLSEIRLSFRRGGLDTFTRLNSALWSVSVRGIRMDAACVGIRRRCRRNVIVVARSFWRRYCPIPGNKGIFFLLFSRLKTYRLIDEWPGRRQAPRTCVHTHCTSIVRVEYTMARVGYCSTPNENKIKG